MLKPWLKQQWCIAPQADAEFVCQREQVLEVYQRPYDPKRPVICMDEQSKQLIEAMRLPWSPRPGSAAKEDYEYVRHGVCTVWMFVEPLAGWRKATASAHRTRIDWAQQVRKIVDSPRYAQAERIILICDNLNTHRLASLYQAFAPNEAMRIARKLELIHTPKHGSWLNVAEIELSVLTRQCLRQRIGELDQITCLSQQWANSRNQKQTGIDWQFRTENARIKLNYLYPKF